MFLSGFKEASLSEIELHVPGETHIFGTLLEFIYTGNMPHLSPDTLIATLDMAFYLQIASAVHLFRIAIMHWYCKNLMSLENALEVLQRPEEELHDLRTQSRHYISSHLLSLHTAPQLSSLKDKLLPTTAQLMEKCIDNVRDIMSDKVSLY